VYIETSKTHDTYKKQGGDPVPALRCVRWSDEYEKPGEGKKERKKATKNGRAGGGGIRGSKRNQRETKRKEKVDAQEPSQKQQRRLPTSAEKWR